MARPNRKWRAADGFVFPAPFAGGMILLAALALGYIWLVSQCQALGREIRELENDRETLVKKYLNEKCRWSQMKSPASLEDALRRNNIVMTWPRNGQVVRINDLHVAYEQLLEMDADALRLAKANRMILNE